MTTQEENIVANLNPDQQAIVTANLQNMMIIAGAGTGKTRVLVQRIAYLIRHYQIQPQSIMAVTFTNKAANEMRMRLTELLGEYISQRIWINTFHAAGLRLLRNFASFTGLQSNITVIEPSEQQRRVQDILDKLNLKNLGNAKDFVHMIDTLKAKGLRPADCTELEQSPLEKESIVPLIYSHYQTICDRDNVVDFSELILRSLELMQNNEQVREYLHRRFQQILVDEFQDTSDLQFNWLRALVGEEANCFAVGDDDQSIYGWRGCNLQNMYKYLKAFNNVQIYQLVQNYRSISSILNCANSLIVNNINRLIEKRLISTKESDKLVQVHAYANPTTESELVAQQVVQKIREGIPPAEIAILYRTNRQSLLIETSLAHAQVPFRIYGGLRFFDREEIKNAIAYLALVVNPNNNVAFDRIINVPSRKIGKVTLNNIHVLALQAGISYLQASQEMVKNSRSSKLQEFVALITKYSSLLEDEPQQIATFMRQLLQEAGLFDYYEKKDQKEQAQDNSRVQNLEELLANMDDTSLSLLQDYLDLSHEFDQKEHQKLVAQLESISVPETPKVSLRELLQRYIDSLSLDSALDGDAKTPSVNLMTIHSAKGLEFNTVFVIGFERNLLPLGNTFSDEEERRLAYVAITRAKENLYLSYSKSYWRKGAYGKFLAGGASPFLREIDMQYLQIDE